MSVAEADLPAAVVELRGLARTYPGAVPVLALKPTDLVIRAGEHVAITGRSGSGKSTLMHLLGLLDQPTEGVYLLRGRDTAALGDRERTRVRGEEIGFVFQSFFLLAHRSVADNVALALLYSPAGRRERAARVATALEQVGLSHRAGFAPAQLSGGERQRVAVARAIVTEPAVLLADEPTGNLDSETAGAVLEVFAKLHQAGQTLVVVTHDRAVAALAGRRLHLNDGVPTETTDAAWAEPVS